MMKAESIVRGFVPNDLALERQESVRNSGEEFRSILDATNWMGVQFPALAETMPGPMCSSGCSDFSSITARDSEKAALVYQRSAALQQSIQSVNVLRAGEGNPSIDLPRGSLPVLQDEEDSVQPEIGSSSPPEPAGGLSHVLTEIRDLFARIFSPEGSSANRPEPPAQQEAHEVGSNDSVTRFFNWLGTVLSFGLWRPEGTRGSGAVSKDALAGTSNGVDGSSEGEGLAKTSARQNLPPGLGDSEDSAARGRIKSTAIRVPPKIREVIEEAAGKYNLSADLIAAIIKVESNFDPGAVSREGAGGLMQLMPSTARALKVGNRFDIQQNVDAGSRYLKSLLDRFGGQVELALAAYNVGPEAVQRYDGVPPYRQTQHYIKKVLAYC